MITREIDIKGGNKNFYNFLFYRTNIIDGLFNTQLPFVRMNVLECWHVKQI